MLAYVIKSALLLAILYGCFALLLSRETFHRFNRLALLAVLFASMLLPAVQLSLEKPGYLSYDLESVYLSTPDIGQAVAASQVPLPAEENVAQVPTSRIDARQFVRHLYLLGLLASISVGLVQIVRLWREVRNGLHTRDEFGNTVVIRSGDFPPYSFLHYIIISVSDYEQQRRPIMAHEQAHIRLGHTCDLLLLEAVKAVQWFNPFVYLLGRDLKAVHEYEADSAVLNLGIDAKTYQLLLVTKAVGGRLQTVCNNLSHHSLKKRIKMMHRHNSNRWLMSKGLILPALMALALVAFARPKTEIRTFTDERPVPTDSCGHKMLQAFRVPADCKNPVVKRYGDGIVVTWLKGTWIQGFADGEEYSSIEDHPVCTSPTLFPTKTCKVKLNGEELDIDNLPDLPASALKKVEKHFESGGERWVNLITMPVEIPAGTPGSINPELTILLTGTVPKGAYQPVTIWRSSGIKDSYDWHDYIYTSWTDHVENVRIHLEEVAIRKDHRVRVNVCKGVPQKHIDRLKNILREKGVRKVDFVQQ